MNDVYWPNQRDVAQPPRKSTDVNRSAADVLQEVHRLQDEPSTHDRA